MVILTLFNSHINEHQYFLYCRFGHGAFLVCLESLYKVRMLLHNSVLSKKSILEWTSLVLYTTQVLSSMYSSHFGSFPHKSIKVLIQYQYGLYHLLVRDSMDVWSPALQIALHRPPLDCPLDYGVGLTQSYIGIWYSHITAFD